MSDCDGGASDSDDGTNDSDNGSVVLPEPRRPGNFVPQNTPLLGHLYPFEGSFDSDGDETTLKRHGAEFTPFEQIEVNDATREELRNRRRQREAFKRWLRSGDGVFHISGKAGSGKSTLIKFLTREKRTRQILEQWAEERNQELVFARFFFWASGEELQNSLEGFYRAVLWKLLSQRPDLISRVFLDDFSSKRSQMPFDQDELGTALDRLFGHEENNAGYPRMCLFIDGLDEYDGDYWKLSRSLLRWSSTGNVKFCVSSRPYTEFMKLFSADPETHFQLHHLTRFDMYHFVSSEFATDGRIQSGGITQHKATDLISEIVDKADGVFLWTRLVTGELLKSAGNHCTSLQLREKLRRLPRGLSPLFHQMILAVDDSERRMAAQTLLILSSTVNGHQKRHLYVHWIMDELKDKPSMMQSITSGGLEPRWSYKHWLSTCQQCVANRMVSRCQGLVQILEYKALDLPLGLRLGFTHRSVSEFLKEDEVRSSLWGMAGYSFNPRRAMIQAILAWIKFQKWSSDIRNRHFPHFDSLVHDLIDLNSKCYHMESLFDHHIFERNIDCLVRMCTQLAATVREGRFRLSIPVWSFPKPSLHPNGCRRYLPVDYRDTDAVITSSIVARGLYGSLAIGLERVKRNPSLLVPRPLGANVLFAAALATEISHKRAPENYILKHLLNLAGCWSNAPCPVSYHFRTRGHGGHIAKSSKTSHIPYLSTPPWTVWTAYLFTLTLNRTPVSDARNSRIFHTFLDNGADPTVCFVGHIKVDGPRWREDIDLFYVTLLDMMLFWGLTLTPKMASVLGIPSQQSTWDYFKRLFNSATTARNPQAREKIPRLDRLPANEPGRCFETLKVVSMEHVQQISLEEAQSVWEKIVDPSVVFNIVI